MEHVSVFLYFLLAFVAFLAGIIDTLAGGGGIITVPALLLAGLNPVAALGTGKLQGAIGELSASLHFLRHHNTQYKQLSFAFVCTIIGSILGTLLLQQIPIHQLEVIIPYFLLAVLLYYVCGLKRHYRNQGMDLVPDNKKFLILGGSIGFYNGFFGPGTGSLWAIALMKVFKLDIKHATIYAKPLNLAGNLSALSIFIVGGDINYWAALAMGLGSSLGGRVGAHFILKRDIKWLKIIFLILMTLSTIATFIKYVF